LITIEALYESEKQTCGWSSYVLAFGHPDWYVALAYNYGSAEARPVSSTSEKAGGIADGVRHNWTRRSDRLQATTGVYAVASPHATNLGEIARSRSLWDAAKNYAGSGGRETHWFKEGRDSGASNAIAIENWRTTVRKSDVVKNVYFQHYARNIHACLYFEFVATLGSSVQLVDILSPKSATPGLHSVLHTR